MSTIKYRYLTKERKTKTRNLIFLIFFPIKSPNICHINTIYFKNKLLSRQVCRRSKSYLQHIYIYLYNLNCSNEIKVKLIFSQNFYNYIIPNPNEWTMKGSVKKSGFSAGSHCLPPHSPLVGRVIKLNGTNLMIKKENFLLRSPSWQHKKKGWSNSIDLLLLLKFLVT